VTRVVWTLQAIEDVEAVRAYIARDSPHYAALLAERLVESVERLQEFPRSGRVVPEVGQEAYREVILGTYRIVYRLIGDVAEILTVVHAARLLPPLVGPGTT
jgi:addiction module RelE/StbE family toxin